MDVLSAQLEEKLKTLPREPGVYLMRDKTGQVIYVGKAKVLANRVRQYFGMGAQKDSKTASMVSHIADFEYIITDTEKEALFLESNLIKEYQPYYNILLKDDKHYPYIRVDMREDFPRVEIVRKIEKDGAKYFGPYLETLSIREILDAAYKIFPIRSCKKEIKEDGRKERPCLNYQMGRCPGPCGGYISKAEYHKVMEEVLSFLSGKFAPVEKELTRQMQEAAARQEYEKAASFRDKLRVLRRIAERQKAGMPNLKDADIFAVTIGEKYGAMQVFFVRRGKLSGMRRFYVEAPGAPEELMNGLLKQFYAEDSMIPKKIYVNTLPEDNTLLQEWFSDRAERKVEIIKPQRGDYRRLADLAGKNAKEALGRKESTEKRAYARTVGAAKSLGELLGMDYIHRMECYDISNTQGTDSVASMVVFLDGKPAKKEYRRFRIKTVEGADDFASMAEVLTRRILEGFRAEDKERGFGAVPDLIVIDGGKGQLSSAVGVLESLGVEDMHVIGLAKREEEIFLPYESEPIVLPKNAPEIGLLTAIRDEAHRFAITYHRNLREKRIISSELDRIKGVGNKRKIALMEAFGDIAGIKKASVDQLAAVKGVDISTAREIYKYFSD